MMTSLRTDRLWLREFRLEDVDALVSYRAHPAYGRYYPEEECGEAAAREQVQRFLA